MPSMWVIRQHIIVDSLCMDSSCPLLRPRPIHAGGLFLWMKPFKARVIHAGGLFLWITSPSHPRRRPVFVDGPFNSDIFLPFYVQAFSEPSLKGLHRRHPPNPGSRWRCGSRPWLTPHFQIANTLVFCYRL